MKKRGEEKPSITFSNSAAAKKDTTRVSEQPNGSIWVVGDSQRQDPSEKGK